MLNVSMNQRNLWTFMIFFSPTAIIMKIIFFLLVNNIKLQVKPDGEMHVNDEIHACIFIQLLFFIVWLNCVYFLDTAAWLE